MTPDYVLPLMIKRSFDIIFSIINLIFLMPAMIIISLIIKFTSPGPILFVQNRCGLNGRIFKMYKFRTMVKDAEELKHSLSSKNEIDGPVFKMKSDPRITKIGKFLRRTSMDELPQFINVLKGEMSIIGPRPPLPQEVKKYKAWQRRRLSMRPGLTCLWQVSGRNNISFEQWMKLDLKYIDDWDLVMDFKILVKTIPAVILGNGAY
jgi:exopolysaccharide biosynthesis polyprenyl glycosylphosphotransferase